MFGIEISPSTVCRTLKRYGLTRKKIRQVALQRSSKLRGSFMAQCFLLKREMLVWVDETGSDSRDNARRCGYALRGVTPTTHRFVYRGRRTSAIAAMASSGIIALELTTHSVNGEKFFDFIRGSLIPNMMAFDGINPRSVVIMDNIRCTMPVSEVNYLRRLGYLSCFSPLTVLTKIHLKRHLVMLSTI